MYVIRKYETKEGNMKKSRFLVIVLSSCLLFSLTGCKSAIPELSQEETDMVTQYMADILLKYDSNYQDALLEQEELELALEEQRENEEEARLQAQEQERIEQEKLEASQPDDIEVAGSQKLPGVEEMAGAVGIDDIEFDYLGYELCSQYPQNDGGELFFAMTPSAGNELLIMKFNLANIGSADCEIDMISQGTGFAIKVNESGYTPVFTTLLENDLSILAQTVPVETGTEVVLISEVPAGTQVDSLVLYVRAVDGNMEIQL